MCVFLICSNAKLSGKNSIAGVVGGKSANIISAVKPVRVGKQVTGRAGRRKLHPNNSICLLLCFFFYYLFLCFCFSGSAFVRRCWCFQSFSCDLLVVLVVLVYIVYILYYLFTRCRLRFSGSATLFGG